MNILVKKLTLTKNPECLSAEFIYPKVLLFEDKNRLSIVDLKTEDPQQSQWIFTFDHEILHHVIRDTLLWIVLKSAEIYVIDINHNVMIKLNISNFANYKICKFVTDDKNLLLMSVSGERLIWSFTDSNLCKEFDKGAKEVTVSLEKVPITYKVKPKQHIFKNGLHMFPKDVYLGIRCPLTGITETISVQKDLECIVPWDEGIVVSSKQQMWLLDLIQYNKQYEFEHVGSQYIPLGYSNNMFYYVTWDTEVKLFMICLNTIENQGQENCSSIPMQTSQDALKTQLKALIHEVIDSNSSEKMNDIQKLFMEIEDTLFLLNLAIKLCKSNIEYKPILFLIQKKVFSTEDIQLINMFNDAIVKIDLLEYIYFRGISIYKDFDLFHMNIVQLCELFVSKSDLDLASICWLKYSKIDVLISAEDILKILNAIPVNIKLGALVIWLRNFLPSLLEDNPFNMDVIAKWTTERVFCLEQSSFWPKIGLKYIEAVSEVLEASQKTITIRPISIDDLDVLKDHITYIMELKDKYKINMLLSEITSQNPTEVALIMLRRCYTEDLQMLLKENLQAYSNRYQFDLDVTIRSFIESQTASSGGSVDGVRLEILLNAIHSVTQRLDCLLNVLKCLDVPWDPKVVTIVKSIAALPFTDFTLTDSDKILAQAIYEELQDATFKIILKKYKFPLYFFDCVSLIHKVVSATNINLDDLKTLTGYVSTHTGHYAHLMYINKCLNECETKEALVYFNSLANREKKIVIRSVVNKYEHIISGDHNITLERNYLDFLKGSQYQSDIEIHALEKMYHLKNSYRTEISLNKLYIEDCVEIKKTISSQNINNSHSGRIHGIHYSNLPHSSLDSLLYQTSTNHKVRAFITELVYLKLHNRKSKEIISQFKHEGNTQLLLLSQEVLSDIICKCPEEYLHPLTEVLALLNAIIYANTIFKNLSIIWKFNYVFLPMSSFSAINTLIDSYESTDLNSLGCDCTDLTPLRIIARNAIYAVATKSETTEVLFKMREKMALKLIAKVVSFPELDQLMLTSLLLLIAQSPSIMNDKTYMLELLRGRSDNTNSALSPCMMYYLSSPVIRDTFELQSVMPGKALTYPPHYILKLKFNIHLEDIAFPDCTEETWDVKVLLFYILKQHPNTSFERLHELCQTLNVCINDGLSLLLISLLINWDLKYVITTNQLGCRKINLENDEHGLISKCLIIWQNIRNKDFINEVLNDFWKNGEVVIHGCVISINPYYYEVLLCIYHLMASTLTEKRSFNEYCILNFLKEYQRKGNPKQYEFEQFSVKGLFPEIGYYRLPFQLFNRDDMWSNLKSEITLETYERWLPIVSNLSLHPDIQNAIDMICSNAVKQTMTSRKPENGADTWKMITSEEPLLRTAHKCVRYIANMEWAGACLFYVLQGCAQGADQVAAAQLCYQFSQRWAVVQPGNRAVRQMEKLHSTLSTRHALHKIDWACEELLRFTSEPTQLIHALYLHPKFVEKIGRHNINRAANEIADKNGININSIRIQILQNLLEKSKDNSLSLNTTELIIAKYILKVTCSKMGAIYLSRIAMDDENDNNKLKKLRALQCLMSVVDQETAVKVTSNDNDKLWPTLLELLYTVYFEKIEMPWLISSFKQDKILTLNQLIQASGSNVNALKVSAEIANRYGNLKNIRDLIPLLLRAALYEQMVPLLLKTPFPLDANVNLAWRAVILSPFQKADYPITEKQKMKCLKAINLLPLCPIVKDEDLLEIWRNCIRCKCPALGCLVLPYMPSETRDKLSELSKIDKRNLIIGLKNLHAESYLVSSAMCVIETMNRKVSR